MTVVAPKLRSKRVLGAKLETTAYTGVTPGNTDAVFNAYDVEIQEDIEPIDREGQSSFDPLVGTLGGMKGNVKFRTDLYGGTSSEPTIFSTLMPACGFSDSVHVYTPLTQAPVSNTSTVKTVSIGVYEDGGLKLLQGAMGTCKMTFPAGKPVRLEWQFWGLWVAPTDVAILQPSYPLSAVPIRFVGSGLTWTPSGGSAFSLRLGEVTIDLGNNVVMREDSSATGGYLGGLITSRKIIGTMSPESTTVANNDIFGQLIAPTPGALAFTVGSSGNQVAVSIPNAWLRKVQEGDRDKVQIDNIEFVAARNSAGGDDSISFTLG